MTLNSVVLPAPFGPMTPTTSPGAADIDTASSARIPPKLTVRSLTTSLGASRSATTGDALTPGCFRRLDRAAAIWNEVPFSTQSGSPRHHRHNTDRGLGDVGVVRSRTVCTWADERGHKCWRSRVPPFTRCSVPRRGAMATSEHPTTACRWCWPSTTPSMALTSWCGPVRGSSPGWNEPGRSPCRATTSTAITRGACSCTASPWTMCRRRSVRAFPLPFPKWRRRGSGSSGSGPTSSPAGDEAADRERLVPAMT